MGYIEDNFDFFKGLSIQSCLRLFNESNFEKIPDEIKEQESDASTFCILSNGDIYAFYANSDFFSIDIKKIEHSDIPSKVSDVSKNQFWKSIIGKKIMNVEKLYNGLRYFYGLRFSFENNIKIDIQYISESDYTFDALIIRKVDNASNLGHPDSADL